MDVVKYRETGEITLFILRRFDWIEEEGCYNRFFKKGFYFDFNVKVFFSLEDPKITIDIKTIEQLEGVLKKQLYKLKRKQNYENNKKNS